MSHAFTALVDLMRRLRSEAGCPWDREQTFESLRPFILEEAHEVADAIDQGDYDELRNEVGDLLFEAVFVSQIAAERGLFTADEALEAVSTKLVRRHPHVFKRAEEPHPPQTGADIVERWEVIKAREQDERGRQRSAFEAVPRSLPALRRAYEVGQRAATVGFDWEHPAQVLEKVQEETREVARELDRRDTRHLGEEIGDLLFAVANLARHAGIEPESALRRANDKFARRFASVEARLREGGRPPGDASLDDMDRIWNEVKAEERRDQRE